MTNNIEHLINLMDFSDPDKFYLVECMQRKKDITDLDRSIRLIKTYCIHSCEQLHKLMPEIIKLCDTFNARAYMYINRRSKRSVGRAMLKTLADYIYSDQYDKLNGLFVSECGKHSAGDKRWILDIDNPSIPFEHVKRVCDVFCDTSHDIEPVGCKLIGAVPTKHGFHLITSPFDLRELPKIKDTLAGLLWTDNLDIELKKDAMVNLYIPD